MIEKGDSNCVACQVFILVKKGDRRIMHLFKTFRFNDRPLDLSLIFATFNVPLANKEEKGTANND
jgi:hypothetical protein